MASIIPLRPEPPVDRRRTLVEARREELMQLLELVPAPDSVLIAMLSLSSVGELERRILIDMIARRAP